MRSFFLLLAVTLITLSFTGITAYAQEQGGALLAPNKSLDALSTPRIILRENKKTEPDIWEKINKLPQDIQEELLNDTANAELRCQTMPRYSDYYDCSCLAVQYLKERYEKGPSDLLFTEKFSDLDLKSCVFKPGIAGLTYKHCFMFVNKQLRQEDQKEVCECAALETAEAFAARPRPEIRYVNNLLISQLGTCQRKLIGRY